MKVGQFEVWEDVFDETLDQYVAPEIGDVANRKAHQIYVEASEFFRRTYFTNSMLDILERLLSTLEGKERHNIFLIYSLFGGGKTHTLLTLYHAFESPDVLFDEDVLKGHDYEKREKIRRIAERIKKLGNVKVAVVYGKGKLGHPSSPLDAGPYQIKTLWGYIAHALGSFSVVEGNDKNLSVPDVETLRDVFRGKKILLLLDEIVHYVDNLKHSGSEDDRRYAEIIDNFLDTLSTALLGSSSAALITMPVEGSGDKLKRVEGEYDSSLVKAIWNAVRRVGGSELYSPMETAGARSDLVNVLKKRIFKLIDEDIKKKSLDKLNSEFSNTDIFGRFTAIEDYEYCYPFHPEYVSILRQIIERSGLQRTRDMLRITRIVVRNLRDKDFGLIMPHYVDLRDDRIKGMFFGRNEIFSGYSTIVDVDLSEAKLSGFKNPELVDFILRYVFLKTFPYDSAVPQAEFPISEAIARGVYEPLIFEKNGWLSVDIADAVEGIENNTSFIYLNIKDGVFWFWRVANVSQMVESKTREFLELREGEVWNRLVGYVSKVIKSVKKKGKSEDSEEHARFFDKNWIFVSKDAEDLRDTPDYKLLILVKDGITENLLERIIYRYGTGKRTYANTVCVCYPLEGSFKNLLSAEARIMACDEVQKQIKSAYGDYGEDVVNIQVGMVKNIKSKAEERLEEQIVSSLRKIAYPKANEVMIISAPSSSRSMIENVYSALVGEEKIMDNLDFDWLKEMLQEVGVSFERNIRFKELVNLFSTNSKLPMIKRDVLEEAIKKGVEKLEIGIKSSGKIFFKEDYDKTQGLPQKEKGVYPVRIADDDLLLSRKEALQEKVCSLIEKESDKIKELDGKKYREKTWYELALKDIDGIYYEPLRKFVTEKDGGWEIREEYIESLVHGQIIERSETKEISEEDFDVELIPIEFIGNPGEQFEAVVKIRPFGEDSISIKLNTNYGSLDQSVAEVRETKTFKWIGTIPEKETEAVLTVDGPSSSKSLRLKLLPKQETAVIEKESLEGLKGTKLVAISNIKSLDVFDALPEAIGGKVKGQLIAKSPYWKSEFSQVDREVFLYLVKEMKEIFNELSLHVDIIFEQEREIDDILFEKLSTIAGKAIFKCKENK